MMRFSCVFLELESCLPEKSPQFVGRDTEVEKSITHLVEKDSGIVSIVGGPGFGKSTIAIEVAHRLIEQHHIPVIFSYLSNTSTMAEVAQRFCLDIGVHPGEDPMSSLIFWLKNIEKKVVLVMDNIEQLLEEETRSQFTELVHLLRKNSCQRLQIVTTSRTKFSIANLTIENVVVEQMDNDSSVELLRKSCPNAKVGDEYLHKLANLCGHVPLALCIAASRLQDVDDPDELLKWLTEKPMDTLQTSEPGHRVQKAINMSFEMLSNKDKKAFVRISVFCGNFTRNMAQEVINREGRETQDFLNNLVNRSLIQRGDPRFFIHPLVRRFLTDHDQLQDERAKAQELMVEHFLKMCHLLTVNYYSKDGFSKARELLKKDAHNVEETLKVCESQGANLNPNIIESLVSSDIFRSSSRFFYNLIRNILPETVIRNFLKSCSEVAKRRGNLAVEISFECLLAEQEGHKSGWDKSREYMRKMEEIKEKFDRNKEELEGDNALLNHFYCCYGRYLCNKKSTPSRDPLEEATNYLQSLKLQEETKSQSPLENAGKVMALIQLARISKKRATKEHSSTDKEKYESYMICAYEHYKRALMLVDKYMGDHELKSTCYKLLGDLFLDWRKPEEALTYYGHAKSMHNKLRFDASEGIVYLLKNYGLCFDRLGQVDKAMQQLNEARDIADKLEKLHTPGRAQVYFTMANILNYRKLDSQDVVKYAKVALELKKFLTKHNAAKMEQIIKEREEGGY